MKIYFLRALTSLLLITLLFCTLASCGQVQYSNTVDCSSLTSSIKKFLPSGDGYSEYTVEEVKYMVDPSLFDSHSIIYSNSSDTIDEVGIFHAKDDTSASLLFEKVNGYVSSMKNEKNDFLRNYLPEELGKLESGEVKQFGNYVVFSFAESNKEIFKNIENMLK